MAKRYRVWLKNGKYLIGVGNNKREAYKYAKKNNPKLRVKQVKIIRLVK